MSEDQTLSLSVDSTTEMLLIHLDGLLTHEPDVPNPDEHEGHQLAEVAMKHYEWERQVSAARLLLGVRLTGQALDAARDGWRSTPELKEET